MKIANRCFFLLLVLWSALPAQGETISIMTFNVENLFDNTHDAGKRDETYLPAFP